MAKKRKPTNGKNKSSAGGQKSSDSDSSGGGGSSDSGGPVSGRPSSGSSSDGGDGPSGGSNESRTKREEPGATDPVSVTASGENGEADVYQRARTVQENNGGANQRVDEKTSPNFEDGGSPTVKGRDTPEPDPDAGSMKTRKLRKDANSDPANPQTKPVDVDPDKEPTSTETENTQTEPADVGSKNGSSKDTNAPDAAASEKDKQSDNARQNTTAREVTQSDALAESQSTGRSPTGVTRVGDTPGADELNAEIEASDNRSPTSTSIVDISGDRSPVSAEDLQARARAAEVRQRGVSPNNVQFQGSDEETIAGAAFAQARAEVERRVDQQIDEQTGSDLQRGEDYTVDVTRNGQEVSAEVQLTEQGRQEVEAGEEGDIFSGAVSAVEDALSEVAQVGSGDESTTVEFQGEGSVIDAERTDEDSVNVTSDIPVLSDAQPALRQAGRAFSTQVTQPASRLTGDVIDVVARSARLASRNSPLAAGGTLSNPQGAAANVDRSETIQAGETAFGDVVRGEEAEQGSETAGERVGEGAGRGVAALANLPRIASTGVTGGEVVNAAVQETAEGDGAEFAKQATGTGAVMAADASQTALENPFRTAGMLAGSLVGSYGAIRGARAVGGTRAARATSYAIQPGEETLRATGRAARRASLRDAAPSTSPSIEVEASTEIEGVDVNVNTAAARQRANDAVNAARRRLPSSDTSTDSVFGRPQQTGRAAMSAEVSAEANLRDVQERLANARDRIDLGVQRARRDLSRDNLETVASRGRFSLGERARAAADTSVTDMIPSTARRRKALGGDDTSTDEIFSRPQRTESAIQSAEVSAEANLRDAQNRLGNARDRVNLGLRRARRDLSRDNLKATASRARFALGEEVRRRNAIATDRVERMQLELREEASGDGFAAVTGQGEGRLGNLSRRVSALGRPDISAGGVVDSLPGMPGVRIDIGKPGAQRSSGEFEFEGTQPASAQSVLDELSSDADANARGGTVETRDRLTFESEDDAETATTSTTTRTANAQTVLRRAEGKRERPAESTNRDVFDAVRSESVSADAVEPSVQDGFSADGTITDVGSGVTGEDVVDADVDSELGNPTAEDAFGKMAGARDVGLEAGTDPKTRLGAEPAFDLVFKKPVDTETTQWFKKPTETDTRTAYSQELEPTRLEPIGPQENGDERESRAGSTSGWAERIERDLVNPITGF